MVFLASLVPLEILVWRGFHNEPDRESHRVHHALDRRLDHAISDPDAGDHSVAKNIEAAAADPLPAHAWAFCVFLRLPALFHVDRLDKFFNWSEMWKDVQKRRFITVGFAGFMLLVPLAVTSTAGWIRRLGGKRWQLLHRLIYVTAILGVIHYWWLVKSDIHKPLQYAVIVGLLLLWRVADWIIQRPTKVATRTATRREAPARAETA